MAANPLAWPLTVDFCIPYEGPPTLVCRGRLTGESSDLLKSEVRKLVPNYKLIAVDLSQVQFMDSSGLGAVVAIYVSAKRVGSELRFINLSRRVRDLFRITRLTSLLEGLGSHDKPHERA